MRRLGFLVLFAGLVGAGCGLTSADRPSCLAVAEAYMSIVRETVDEGVPPDVTQRTIDRTQLALDAAIDDGNVDQESRCRLILRVAVAARDLSTEDFATVWAVLEEEGFDPSR
ncbi:hypothetical protein HQ535_06075 [bacterium]|nr:hypothetical protein [bacterium]